MLHFIFDFSARLRRESNENRFRLKKNQYHPILDLEIMRKVDESKIYCSLLDLFEELILILVHYLIPRPEKVTGMETTIEYRNSQNIENK